MKFFTTRFSSGHVECKFDNRAGTFAPNIRISFTRNLVEKLKNIFSQQKSRKFLWQPRMQFWTPVRKAFAKNPKTNRFKGQKEEMRVSLQKNVFLKQCSSRNVEINLDIPSERFSFKVWKNVLLGIRLKIDRFLFLGKNFEIFLWTDGKRKFETLLKTFSQMSAKFLVKDRKNYENVI